MKKYDFSNITFIIPIRIDSTIRLENLLITIGLLNRWRANILIVHADRYDNHFITKHGSHNWRRDRESRGASRRRRGWRGSAP